MEVSLTALVYRHRWLWIRMPIAVLALVIFALLWIRTFPLPPARLVFSAGLPDGAYHQHARRYAEVFARHGIAVEILESDGSALNLERLAAVPAQADLALVQGGFGWSSPIDDSASVARVQSLGNMDVEAVWLFSRVAGLHSLSQLKGQRLAAGPTGSGHRALAQRLLRPYRIRPDDIRWSPLTGAAAATALRNGEIDSVLMVASPSSPAVRALLEGSGQLPIGLSQIRKVALNHNFLEPRLLAQDALGDGKPARDTTVLTTPTHLLVRVDLHPSLKRLAARVATEVHGGEGVFHRAGDFPALRVSDFPGSIEARQTYAGLADPLHRWLPFWWAEIVFRLLVVGLPVLIGAWLLWRAVPAWLRWRLNRQIAQTYGELRFIEDDLNSSGLSPLEFHRVSTRLAAIEQSLDRIRLPEDLLQRQYQLHQHIGFVRRRLERMRGR